MLPGQIENVINAESSQERRRALIGMLSNDNLNCLDNWDIIQRVQERLAGQQQGFGHIINNGEQLIRLLNLIPGGFITFFLESNVKLLRLVQEQQFIEIANLLFGESRFSFINFMIPNAEENTRPSLVNTVLSRVDFAGFAIDEVDIEEFREFIELIPREKLCEFLLVNAHWLSDSSRLSSVLELLSDSLKGLLSESNIKLIKHLTDNGVLKLDDLSSLEEICEEIPFSQRSTFLSLLMSNKLDLLKIIESASDLRKIVELFPENRLELVRSAIEGGFTRFINNIDDLEEVMEAVGEENALELVEFLMTRLAIHPSHFSIIFQDPLNDIASIALSVSSSLRPRILRLLFEGVGRNAVENRGIEILSPMPFSPGLPEGALTERTVGQHAPMETLSPSHHVETEGIVRYNAPLFYELTSSAEPFAMLLNLFSISQRINVINMLVTQGLGISQVIKNTQDLATIFQSIAPDDSEDSRRNTSDFIMLIRNAVPDILRDKNIKDGNVRAILERILYDRVQAMRFINNFGISLSGLNIDKLALLLGKLRSGVASKKDTAKVFKKFFENNSRLILSLIRDGEDIRKIVKNLPAAAHDLFIELLLSLDQTRNILFEENLHTTVSLLSSSASLNLLVTCNREHVRLDGLTFIESLKAARKEKERSIPTLQMAIIRQFLKSSVINRYDLFSILDNLDDSNNGALHIEFLREIGSTRLRGIINDNHSLYHVIDNMSIYALPVFVDLLGAEHIRMAAKKGISNIVECVEKKRVKEFAQIRRGRGLGQQELRPIPDNVIAAINQLRELITQQETQAGTSGKQASQFTVTSKSSRVSQAEESESSPEGPTTKRGKVVYEEGDSPEGGRVASPDADLVAIQLQSISDLSLSPR